MTLCSLSDVKTLLGISPSDLSQDAVINLLIDRVSRKIAQELGYPVARATYTAEKYSVNNTQKLYLRAFPVQSVASVTLAGVAVTDYDIDLDGSLYRGLGWCGNYYTRTMSNDPVSGFREIVITYTAGWYLPGDVGYVADAITSLPGAIVSAALEATIENYRVWSMGSEAVSAHSEGGISDTFLKKGLSDATIESLSTFKYKYGIA